MEVELFFFSMGLRGCLVFSNVLTLKMYIIQHMGFFPLNTVTKRRIPPPPPLDNNKKTQARPGRNEVIALDPVAAAKLDFLIENVHRKQCVNALQLMFV